MTEEALNHAPSREETVSAPKFTPGPWSVRQPERWPFDIEIVGPDGDVLVSETRPTHSTTQKSVADCMAAVGFPRGDRDEAIAANQRHLADVTLRAAAPELLGCLEGLIRAVESKTLPAMQLAAEFGRQAIAKARGEDRQ